MRELPAIDRRTLLTAVGSLAVAGAAAGCSGDTGGTGGTGGRPGAGPAPSGAASAAPPGKFVAPSSRLSGALRIMMWRHAVPAHDSWFDPWARGWGSKVGVRVDVDHVSSDTLLSATQAELQSGQGHDLILHLAPVPQFELGVLDLADVVTEVNRRHGRHLELCQNASYNPATRRFFAFAPAWAPDVGNYRRSLWTPVGLPRGPVSWEDLRTGGARIVQGGGPPVGLGLTQGPGANVAARSLLWSFGASTQNPDGQVVINSPETAEAVAFMTRLYREAMTVDSFTSDVAANDHLLASGQRSYVSHTISGLRDAEDSQPAAAADLFLAPALSGPAGAQAACRVMYNWIVPKATGNPRAAMEFLIHYATNLDAVTWHSRLHDLPAHPGAVPQLSNWLAKDPFAAHPPNTFSLLANATDWSRNVGYPGPVTAAEGEMFASSVVPRMFARAVRGEVSPRQAIGDAEAQLRLAADRWRSRGLMERGGS